MTDSVCASQIRSDLAPAAFALLDRLRFGNCIAWTIHAPATRDQGAVGGCLHRSPRQPCGQHSKRIPRTDHRLRPRWRSTAMQPLQQALQAYPEQSGPYADIRQLLGAPGPAPTVQVWTRVGFAPPAGPASRRGLQAPVRKGSSRARSRGRQRPMALVGQSSGPTGARCSVSAEPRLAFFDKGRRRALVVFGVESPDHVDGLGIEHVGQRCAQAQVQVALHVAKRNRRQ